MKTKIITQTAFLLLAFATSAIAAEIFERPLPANPDALRVMTANIRQLYGSVDNDETNDPNVWIKRKDIVRDTLIAQKADIICFQECRSEQLDYFMEGMPGFDFYAFKVPFGTGSYRPANPGNAIFYSTDRFELLEADGFYLSDTPRALQSSYPEALNVRFANWAKFRDKKTDRVIKVWNTHLDHLSGDAGTALKGKQIKVLINAVSAEPPDSPQILTGDLNSTPGLTQDFAPYRQLTVFNGWTDTWTEMGNTNTNSNPTSNPGFGGNTTGSKIDYIMRKGKLRAIRTEIIRDYRTVDGVNRYPSDHYFVSADLEYDTSSGPIPDPASFTSPRRGIFTDPVGLALDNSGNLYIADEYQNYIKRVALATSGTAIPDVLAGMGAPGYIDNDRGDMALFMRPRSLAFLNNGLFVADSGNKIIRAVDIDSTAVSRFTGAFYYSSSPAADGDRDTARFVLPASVVTAPDGTVYVADSDANAIRKIAPDGAVSTLAGTLGSAGAADGLGGSARFNEPLGLALDPAVEYLYVADTGNHTIRKIALGNASVTTLAGSAGAPGSTDGTGGSARFNTPSALVYVSGTLYVADTFNHVIRAVDAISGATQVLTGTPGFEMPVVGMTKVLDGAPTEALFSHPSGITADTSGNLYVADTGNAAIRRISLTDGATTTSLFAGSPISSMPETDDTGGGGQGGDDDPPAEKSGGGGGGVSPWCLLALALLVLARGKTRRA